MKRDIIIYRENDIYELPVAPPFNSITECAVFIGCTQQALYKNMQLYGVMKANGFVLELVTPEESLS